MLIQLLLLLDCLLVAMPIGQQPLLDRWGERTTLRIVGRDGSSSSLLIPLVSLNSGSGSMGCLPGRLVDGVRDKAARAAIMCLLYIRDCSRGRFGAVRCGSWGIRCCSVGGPYEGAVAAANDYSAAIKVCLCLRIRAAVAVLEAYVCSIAVRKTANRFVVVVGVVVTHLTVTSGWLNSCCDVGVNRDY